MFRLFKKLRHLPTMVHRSWSSIAATTTDASRRFLEVVVHRRRSTSYQSTVLPSSSSGDSSDVTRALPPLLHDGGILVISCAARKHVNKLSYRRINFYKTPHTGDRNSEWSMHCSTKQTEEFLPRLLQTTCLVQIMYIFGR